MENNIPRDIPVNRYWFLMGKFYGYPTCCILSFLRKAPNHTPLQMQVAKHKGFVPCVKCTVHILENQKDLSSLITNRISLTTFPHNDGDNLQIKHFLEKYEDKTLSELLQIFK